MTEAHAEPEAPVTADISATFASAGSPAEAPWWKNVYVVIAGIGFAGLGFFLSLATAIISAHTAYKKDIHDQQAELSAVVEKLLQIPVTQATQSPGLAPMFTEQSRMLTLRAYNLARSLGSNAAAPELMTVASRLASFENYRAAKQIARQAAEVANDFSDEVSALRGYGGMMITFAESDRERTEGDNIFEEAMNISSKYPDVGRNSDEISYTHALTQLAWTDAWSRFDCSKAEFHAQKADEFVRRALAGPGGPEVQSRALAWHDALLHCDKNKLPFEWYPPAPGVALAPPPVGSDQHVPPTFNAEPPTRLPALSPASKIPSQKISR